MNVTTVGGRDGAPLTAGTDLAGHAHATTMATASAAGLFAGPIRLTRLAPAGRFVLHFLEMAAVMMVGMAPYHALLRDLPPEYAAWFARGTYAYSLGMALSMALPMVPWMKLRGHGWRPGLEMAVAMFAPTVVVVVLCALGLDQTQPWIRNADGPAMLLAMLGLMLCRRDHYLGGHRTHAHHA